MRRRTVLVSVVAAMGVGLLGVYLGWDALRLAWWRNVPLTEGERVAIETCGDSGWSGAMKLAYQRVAHPCGVVWLGRQWSAHLSVPGRKGALVDITAEDDLPTELRLSAAIARILAGEVAPAGFSPWLRLRSQGAARADVFGAIREGQLPRTILDPVLLEDLRWQSPRWDDDRAELIADLRAEAALGFWPPELAQQRLGVVLDRLDLRWEDLGRQGERHRSGRAPQRSPELSEDFPACEPIGAPCLLAVAALLEEGTYDDEASAGEAQGTSAPGWLGARDESRGAISRRIEAWTSWVSGGKDPEERVAALLGAVEAPKGGTMAAHHPLAPAFLGEGSGEAWVAFARSLSKDPGTEEGLQGEDPGLKIRGRLHIVTPCEGALARAPEASAWREIDVEAGALASWADFQWKSGRRGEARRVWRWLSPASPLPSDPGPAAGGAQLWAGPGASAPAPQGPLRCP